MSHFLVLGHCAFHPHHPLLLTSAFFGVQKSSSGTLHSLDSVLDGVSLLGATRTIGAWVGFGMQGPEETVLGLRTKGCLQHAHHLSIPFRSGLSLSMFVWSAYEYHSIPFSSGYQRQSMQENKELLSDLVSQWNNMISFSILICRGHYIISFDFYWRFTG